MPKLAWEDHRITVTGLGVAETQVLSMDELVALPQRTLPITLVCAGNRRKEVNVTRQSKGFSWGSGAVSTSIWTGVPLHVLLRHCGVDPEALEPGSYWVNFDGPDGELPKGVYGTSIPLLKVSRGRHIDACMPSHSCHPALCSPHYFHPLRRWTRPRTCWWPSSRTTSASSLTTAFLSASSSLVKHHA